MNKVLRIGFGLLVGVATVWSFHIPPDMDFQQPQLARIFVWHLPCSIVATFLMYFGAYFSLRVLLGGGRKWDERAASANELSYLFCLLTMATGILFSEVQWGAWWQWDPRQSSFLMVLFVYAAYFVIRGAFHDPEKRASHSAAYALAALLPGQFLIFIYPYLPQVKSQSFHPTGTVLEGKIKGEYAYVVMTILALMIVLAFWLYRLRIRAGLAALETETENDRLALHSGDTAPSGVVRRVPVPPES